MPDNKPHRGTDTIIDRALRHYIEVCETYGDTAEHFAKEIAGHHPMHWNDEAQLAQDALDGQIAPGPFYIEATDIDPAYDPTNPPSDAEIEASGKQLSDGAAAYANSHFMWMVAQLANGTPTIRHEGTDEEALCLTYLDARAQSIIHATVQSTLGSILTDNRSDNERTATLNEAIERLQQHTMDAIKLWVAHQMIGGGPN